MPQLIFEGKVFSGRGEGKRFVGLPWVKRQIMQKTGFTPYDGTLNLCLTGDSVEKRRQLDQANGSVVEPEAGFCPGILFRGYIEGLECAVILPKVPNYPVDILEVVASQNLRCRLGLADGNTVAVAVTF
jgi:riboflavin kinase, archaea type